MIRKLGKLLSSTIKVSPLILALSAFSFGQMILAPVLKQRYFDANGIPLVGGKLYSYVATTETPQATYSNATGSLNANPVVLDANGEANVWINPELDYKFVLKNSSDVTQWTVDRIADDDISTARIEDEAVTTAKIDDNAVTTAKILDNAVTGAKLSSSGVTDALRAVDSNHIKDGAIDGVHLSSDAKNKAKSKRVSISCTGNITASVDQDFYRCDGSSAITVSLPAATSSYKPITIEKYDSDLTTTVTVDPNGSESIVYNGTSYSTFVLYTPNESVTLTLGPQGDNWHVTSHKTDSGWQTVSGATGGYTGTPTYVLRYMRVGAGAFFDGSISFNGTAAASNPYINLPWTMSSTGLPLSTTLLKLGAAWGVDVSNTANNFTGFIAWTDSTKLGFPNTITWASGDYINFQTDQPINISGWLP